MNNMQLTVDHFNLGVFWGKRPESRDRCAEQAERFFGSLAQVDPLFTTWYEKGASREEALQHPVVLQENALNRLLRDVTPRSSVHSSQMVELGYLMSLWTGGVGGEATDITLYCGSCSDYSANCCGLSLPYQGAVASRLLAVSVLTDIFRVMVHSWEPDYGRITSPRTRSVLGQPAGRIEPGWITYLSSHYDGLKLPPFQTEAIANHGRLLMITEDRFSSDNDRHISSLRDLATALAGQQTT